MNVYEELRQILDTHPSGTPKSEAFDEILKTLFTSEEAALAVCMGFRPKVAGTIAEAACASRGAPSTRSNWQGRDQPPAIFDTAQEMGMKMAEGKGKIEAFLRVLQR